MSLLISVEVRSVVEEGEHIDVYTIRRAQRESERKLNTCGNENIQIQVPKNSAHNVYQFQLDFFVSELL